MDTTDDNLRPRLSGAKSCDNLLLILGNDLEGNYNTPRNSFSRQGAFRRRIIEMDIDTENKKSVLGNNNEVTKEDVEKDQVFQKRVRTSVVSLTVVKEMWKSFKNDKREKEEMRKRNLGERNDSINANTSIFKVESLDIQTFLHMNGEIISEKIDDSIILPNLSWTELNDQYKTLEKNEIEKQASIWELIESESSYINKLSVVVHVFYPLLHKLLFRYHNEFPGVEVEDIFGNINEIYTDHWNLWNTCISVPLLFTNIKKGPLEISLMKGGLSRISTILKSYIHFMSALPLIRKTIDKLQKENIIFNEYVQWTQKYCRLCHDGCLCILSAPFQRITKYKLLLEKVRSVSSLDQQEVIDGMITNVHNFLQQLNSSMIGKYSMRDIKEKIVETNIAKNHIADVSKFVKEESMYFDISRPLSGFYERILIHEGRLKLKECCSKTVDVQCYLCNDLFIICKPMRINWDKLKILKSPIRLDKILVKEESEGCLVIIIYNDFRIVESILTLTGDKDEIKLWVNLCTKTKITFVSQFTDFISPSIVPVSDYYEIPVTTDDKEVIFDECNPSFHSETSSSGNSTYSADSFSTQVSGTSRLPERQFIVNRSPLPINYRREKSHSVEEIRFLNEKHFYPFDFEGKVCYPEDAINELLI